MRRRLASDDGSTLLLTIFYSALAIALILLVVAATSLYLERKRLYTLADGASLVGAESFALDDVHKTDRGYRPTLHSSEVRASVLDYLKDNPVEEFSGLHVDRAVSADGRSATVELSLLLAASVLGVLIPNGFRIQVTSIARSVFS